MTFWSDDQRCIASRNKWLRVAVTGKSSCGKTVVTGKSSRGKTTLGREKRRGADANEELCYCGHDGGEGVTFKSELF